MPLLIRRFRYHWDYYSGPVWKKQEKIQLSSKMQRRRKSIYKELITPSGQKRPLSLFSFIYA